MNVARVVRDEVDGRLAEIADERDRLVEKLTALMREQAELETHRAVVRANPLPAKAAANDVTPKPPSAEEEDDG